MKALVIGLLALTSVSCFAGTSKQDPSIKALRAEFSKAATASIGDLTLNKPYACEEFMATPDDFRHTSNTQFVLKKFDGMVKVLNGKSKHTVNFRYLVQASNGSLIGTNSDGNVLSVKMLQNKNLIMENSTADTRSLDDQSITNSRMSAVSYFVCEVVNL
jgi:hypothetical protein